jgi:hypothetical protein
MIVPIRGLGKSLIKQHLTWSQNWAVGPCTFAVFGESILGMRIRGSGIAAPQARAQSVAHWAANPSI